MCLRFVLTLLLSFHLLPHCLAQALPSTASANLYFPHFVVGGNPNDYWVTSFDFVNPNGSEVRVWLYGNTSAGDEMALKLNGVAAAEHVFDIPAYGTFTLASGLGPQDLQVGWVDAYAAMPIQGVATYTRYRNGVVVAKLTAESSQQTNQYVNLANPTLGIALANRNDFAIELEVEIFDDEGIFAGSHTVELPAWGHTAFNLFTPFPNLPQNFKGTVSVFSQTFTVYFLGWSVYDDGSGVNTALPAGSYRRPVNQRDRIENVFYSLSEAFAEQVEGELPDLSIISDVSQGPNAYAQDGPGDQDTVGITLALAELLGDSTDELAAVVAHEMGHVAQFREGGTIWDDNPERDADVRGTLLALQAGYDPYALAGALSKLSMASGQAGLITQWEALSSGEIHGSFNDRLATVFNTLVAICSIDGVAEDCNQYRAVYHPHLPAAPLRRGGRNTPVYQLTSTPHRRLRSTKPLRVTRSKPRN